MTRRASDMSNPLLRRAALEADGRGTPGNDCLGADAAAAWADGTLTPAETMAVRTHAAGCARCRSLLAALVQTGPRAAAARAPWWKAPVVRWAAPLAAATGVLLVWVVVERGPAREFSAPATQPAAPAESGRAARSEPSAKAPSPAENAPLRDPQPPKTPPPSAVTTAQRGVTADTGKRASVDALARQRVEKPAEAPAAPTETLTVLSESAQAFAPAVVVAAPDGSTRWRVTQPGSIERSADGGATWERQAIDTRAILTAGTSPGPETCWLVGSGGTVLRTTDGRTWRRTSVPDPSDLAAVSAKDADIATVTTVDGRVFRTTDGGLTWSR